MVRKLRAVSSTIFVVSLLIVLVAGATVAYLAGASAIHTLTLTSTLTSVSTSVTTATRNLTATSTSISRTTTTFLTTSIYNYSYIAYQLASVPSQGQVSMNFTFIYPKTSYSFTNFEFDYWHYVTNYGWRLDTCSPCVGVNGSAVPSNATELAGANLTVHYTISVSAGVQAGLYWLDLHYCGWPFLFVVGTLPSSIPGFIATPGGPGGIECGYGATPRYQLIGTNDFVATSLPTV
jgi:hypothetical protein